MLTGAYLEMWHGVLGVHRAPEYDHVPQSLPRASHCVQQSSAPEAGKYTALTASTIARACECTGSVHEDPVAGTARRATTTSTNMLNTVPGDDLPKEERKHNVGSVSVLCLSAPLLGVIINAVTTKLFLPGLHL